MKRISNDAEPTPIPRQHRHQLILLVLTLILTLATTVSAQQDEPNFYIETITVEGLIRASSVILVSESRLETNQEYTESQLRQAVYRINRLPFVVESRFSLRKGSERNTYELVITVEETERFFFGVDLRGSHREYASRYGSFEDSSADSRLTAGIRQFIGAGGVLYGSVQPGYNSAGDQGVVGTYSAGYTQYNLFDKPISLTLGLSYQDANFRIERYSFGLAFQLPRSQKLQLSWHASSSDFTSFCVSDPSEPVIPCTSSSSSQNILLDWRYDTSDDLLFPTHGTVISATAQHSSGDADFLSHSIDNTHDYAYSSGSLRISGRHHFPLGGQHSIAPLASINYSRHESKVSSWNPEDGEEGSDSNRYGIGAGMQYNYDLLRTTPRGKVRDLRWMSSLDLRHNTFGDENSQNFGFYTGLVFRSRWGVFRLVLSYKHNLGSSR